MGIASMVTASESDSISTFAFCFIFSPDDRAKVRCVGGSVVHSVRDDITTSTGEKKKCRKFYATSIFYLCPYLS